MKYALPLLFLLAGCADWFKSVYTPPPPPPPGPPPPPAPAQLHTVGTFANPTFATSPPGDTTRLFVTERAGRIVLLKNDVAQAGAFLDLRGKISDTVENGLYSMAFHPQYATNGRFYVYYTNPSGNIRIVRYNVSSDPDSADPATADTVLQVAHPL